MLKERRPYQEPDPKQMHESEKAKLVRHHAKRLRQLGADNELVEQLVTRLSQPMPAPQPRRPQRSCRQSHPQSVPRQSLLRRTRISGSPNTQNGIFHS